MMPDPRTCQEERRPPITVSCLIPAVMAAGNRGRTVAAKGHAPAQRLRRSGASPRYPRQAQPGNTACLTAPPSQRPPFEHEKTRQQRRGRGDQQHRSKGVSGMKGNWKRNSQRVDHGAHPSSQDFRADCRLASCAQHTRVRGETKASRKIGVCRVTITPPVPRREIAEHRPQKLVCLPISTTTYDQPWERSHSR